MPETGRLSPVALLLWCGVLLGAGFPLSKISFGAGISPLLWALLVSVGASISLLPVLGVRGQLALPRGRMLRYVVISGLVSFAGINLMIFALVPKLGAGQVGMMFALSPVATPALSVLFGMKAPGRLGLWGIGLGLIGALMVAFGRGGVEGGLLWSLVGLAIPLILAAGNVYRSLDWPEGAHPMALAFWSHGVAIVALLAVMLWRGEGVDLERLSAVPWAALAQMGAAAVGLVIGVLLLGERYGLVSWMGAAVTAGGIALTVLAQSRFAVVLPMPLGRRTRARVWMDPECGRARAARREGP